ncbi:MAG TPA: regulatory protein RecX [Myxococcota bacterium]|nr:regulatory protein RecX [Myxococcota bacterium]
MARPPCNPHQYPPVPGDADAGFAAPDPATLSPEAAIQTALRLLGPRPLSVAELGGRLERRGFGADAIDAAVRAMQGYRYLDDSRLAEGVRASAERRGKGPQWIRNTLLKRGVSPEVAQSAAQVERAEALAQARALLHRRFSDPEALSEPRTRQRAFRFLCSRGFSSECVLAALRSSYDDLDTP